MVTYSCVNKHGCNHEIQNFNKILAKIKKKICQQIIELKFVYRLSNKNLLNSIHQTEVAVLESLLSSLGKLSLVLMFYLARLAKLATGLYILLPLISNFFSFLKIF